MRDSFSMRMRMTGFAILSFVVPGIQGARAQVSAELESGQNSATAWQSYDWLAPAEQQQRQAASGETFQATAGQDVSDPFAVLSSDSLWQEKYGAVYGRQLSETLSLSCDTSAVVLDDDSEDLSKAQKVGVQFQPVEQLTLRGDLHGSTIDTPLSSESTITSGTTFSAEGHLPLSAVLTLGVQTDRTSIDAPAGLGSQTNAYDAQWKQPIGQLPLTAVLKGHYE